MPDTHGSRDSRRRDTGRSLDAAEQAAARRVFPHLWTISTDRPDEVVGYQYGKGPIHWARDGYWPRKLDEIAAEAEQLARDARLIAKVMREREP